MTPTPSGHSSRAERDETRASDFAAPSRRVARLARVAVLATTDFVALVLAGGLAYSIWALPVKGQSVTLYLELIPLISLFLFGYAQSGLYPGLGLGPVETLRRQSYVTAFGYLVLAAFTFALKLPHLYSRVTFTIALAEPGHRPAHTCASAPPFVALVERTGGHRRHGGTRGPRDSKQSARAPRLRSVLDRDASRNRQSRRAVPIVGDLACAADLAARGIRVALMGGGNVQDRTIGSMQRHFGHVVLLREYDDLPVEGIHVRSLGSLVGIEYTNNLLLAGNRAIKRALDILVAGVLLLVTAPVVAALLVRRDMVGRLSSFARIASGHQRPSHQRAEDTDDEAECRAAVGGVPCCQHRRCERSGKPATS